MIEFVLAVSMMYVSNKGEIRSFPFSGKYRTHAACVRALRNEIENWTAMNTVLTPVGTDMCVQREAPVLKPSELGCSAAAGAGAAAAAAADKAVNDGHKKPKLSARKIEEAAKAHEAATYTDCMQGTGIFAN